MTNQETIIDILRVHADWMRLDTLAELAGMSERAVRKEVSHSSGEIISTTAGGYLHITHATFDNVRHAKREIDSRIDELLRRRNEIEQAWRIEQARRDRLEQTEGVLFPEASGTPPAAGSVSKGSDEALFG